MTNKDCLKCGTSFVAYRRTAKYCSRTCSRVSRQEAYQGDGRNGTWVYYSQVKRLYGLSADELIKMNEAQNYSCMLCETHVSEFTTKKKRLCVDHCHTTGKVRGLLCESCNTMLGMSKDNIETLKRAVAYLERNAK